MCIGCGNSYQDYKYPCEKCNNTYCINCMYLPCIICHRLFACFWCGHAIKDTVKTCIQHKETDTPKCEEDNCLCLS
jgi:hypothetical protein